jgi:hypothetical protein
VKGLTQEERRHADTAPITVAALIVRLRAARVIERFSGRLNAVSRRLAGVKSECGESAVRSPRETADLSGVGIGRKLIDVSSSDLPSGKIHRTVKAIGVLAAKAAPNR